MTDRDKFEGLIAFLRKAKDNNDVNDERYCCVIDGLIDDFIASMQEEPVSEELEQAAEHFAFHHTYSGDMEYIAENEKEAFKKGAQWQKEQVVKEIVASVPPSTPKLTPKRRCKNDVVQFELKSVYGRSLKSEYDWCLKNLPLKDDYGLVYQVNEIFIITRSQRIIDKVNRHFGSSFSFKNWQESRIFYIE